eukprot:SAG11_NODE_165_length_13834_cov_72.998544_3_plen_412_part_00
MKERNLLPMLNHVLHGVGGVRKLAFVWGQEQCTDTGQMAKDNPNKPIFLKDLQRVFAAPEHTQLYTSRNTLLIDDDEYKTSKNAPNSHIVPQRYDGRAEKVDEGLGRKGALWSWLEQLALTAEPLPQWVGKHPLPSKGSTTPAVLPASRQTPSKARATPVPHKSPAAGRGLRGQEQGQSQSRPPSAKKAPTPKKVTPKAAQRSTPPKQSNGQGRGREQPRAVQNKSTDSAAANDGGWNEPAYIDPERGFSARTKSGNKGGGGGGAANPSSDGANASTSRDRGGRTKGGSSKAGGGGGGGGGGGRGGQKQQIDQLVANLAAKNEKSYQGRSEKNGRRGQGTSGGGGSGGGHGRGTEEDGVGHNSRLQVTQELRNALLSGDAAALSMAVRKAEQLGLAREAELGREKLEKLRR